MANTLGIPERTLAQLSSAGNSINIIDGGSGSRLSAYEPLVVRVTDHKDDSGATGDEVGTMAIFKSKAHGQPWEKDGNVLVHKVVKAAADPVANPTPNDVSVLFPNFDYSTF